MTSIQIKLLDSKLHSGASLKVSRYVLSKVGTKIGPKQITQIQKKIGYKAILIFKWKYLLWNIISQISVFAQQSSHFPEPVTFFNYSDNQLLIKIKKLQCLSLEYSIQQDF